VPKFRQNRRWLTGRTQLEIHGGLNVVENWNATNDFLCFGRQGELATNSRERQEIVTLPLQLLQLLSCLLTVTWSRGDEWGCPMDSRHQFDILRHGNLEKPFLIFAHAAP
jgi:hypothetical protein